METIYVYKRELNDGSYTIEKANAYLEKHPNAEIKFLSTETVEIVAENAKSMSQPMLYATYDRLDNLSKFYLKLEADSLYFKVEELKDKVLKCIK